MKPPHSLTATEALASIASGTLDSESLIRDCLERIAARESKVRAWAQIDAEGALRAAREADKLRQVRSSRLGPLHGIPIGVKDVIGTAELRTEYNSPIYQDHRPNADAAAVAILRAAGAIVIGKTETVEFAAWRGRASLARNPNDLSRTPGGSSSGSAAAVADCMVPVALGTQTGGSMIRPASYCGVVGFKPTYGRVSCHGVVPLSWTLDHVGPICKTVEDCALMLDGIAGYDTQDPASADVPVQSYTRALNLPLAKLRLGIPRNPYFEGLDAEVQKALETAIGVLAKFTSGARDVTLPPANGLNLIGPEAYAYHAKWISESPNLYQPATRAILQRSADSKAPAYADALHRVYLLRREIRKTFDSVDVLITPTMPLPPVTIEASLTQAVTTRNTAPFDIYGLPTISVPCGFISAGLPIGVQISGAPFAEPTVLALAHAYEQATPWHTRRPSL